MDTPTDVAVEIIGRSRATPTLSLGASLTIAVENAGKFTLFLGWSENLLAATSRYAASIPLEKLNEFRQRVFTSQPKRPQMIQCCRA